MHTDDLLPLKVLSVLEQHTDENHTLTQARLAQLLRREYGLNVPARTLRRLLAAMADFDDRIEFDETTRAGSFVRTNFFLRHSLSDGELRLLLDSVAFLPYLPAGQRQDLLDKVRQLGSRFFDVRPLLTTPSRLGENKQLFLNVELLDEAIRSGKKICARYLAYGTDKKLCSRRDSAGREREYRLSPYRMLMNDGRYYLVCNNDRYNDLAHYRIDRLTNVRILEEDVRPLRELDPGRRTDTDAYIREHVYMYSGEGISAVLRLRPACLTEAVDLFGPAISFCREEGGWIPARVRAHPLAICRFVRSCGPAAVLEAPADLRRQLCSELAQSLTQYGPPEEAAP